MTQKKDIGKILRQFGLVFVALFIIVFMSIKSDVFLTSQNIINILRQISINGILAVGMTFVILTGGIDLSVGSVVAITGVIVGSLLQSGTNWFLASLAALVISAICGVFNGWLISYVGFQPFIATLSTMTIGRGFAQVYSNGKPYTISDPSFKVIGQGYFLGIPVPIILLVIFCIIGLVILTMTTFGRYVFAIGGNMNAAKLSGVRTQRVQLMVYVIVDNGDIGDKNYTAFVGCTDQESGELLGKWFMEESGLEKGSKVAIIEGPMGQSGQVGRMAGFEEVGMLDYFDVVATQTANWKRDEAMALAEDWITTYGDDLKAIICENDDMGMGALSAAQAAGRDDIIIGGVDGLDDAVAAVKDGSYGICLCRL